MNTINDEATKSSITCSIVNNELVVSNASQWSSFTYVFTGKPNTYYKFFLNGAKKVTSLNKHEIFTIQTSIDTYTVSDEFIIINSGDSGEITISLRFGATVAGSDGLVNVTYPEFTLNEYIKEFK